MAKKYLTRDCMLCNHIIADTFLCDWGNYKNKKVLTLQRGYIRDFCNLTHNQISDPEEKLRRMRIFRKRLFISKWVLIRQYIFVFYKRILNRLPCTEG